MTSLPTSTLSPGEAAAWLTAAGVPTSESTVRRWLKSGRIAAVHLPFGRLRVRLGDLEELLEPKAVAS